MDLVSLSRHEPMTGEVVREADFLPVPTVDEFVTMLNGVLDGNMLPCSASKKPMSLGAI